MENILIVILVIMLLTCGRFMKKGGGCCSSSSNSNQHVKIDDVKEQVELLEKQNNYLVEQLGEIKSRTNGEG